MESSPISTKDSIPPWERDRSIVNPPRVSQQSKPVRNEKQRNPKKRKEPRAENHKRRSMKEFDKNYSAFRLLMLQAGFNIRFSNVSKHSKHVMVEDLNGKRLLNYWPSTKRAYLVSRNKYFVVADHLSVVQCAIHGDIVGAVEIQPEPKPDALTAEFLSISAWF